eukprot:1150426-Pelagomonas_calceolata.AAC.4
MGHKAGNINLFGPGPQLTPCAFLPYFLGGRFAPCFCLKKEKDNYAGNENTPQTIKEKRTPRSGAPCIPFTKRSKRKKSMGIRRVTSSSPCLILGMRVERSLLKNASSANKFISTLDAMGMKLQSKLDGCMSVKTKHFKKFQSVRCVDDPAHT